MPAHVQPVTTIAGFLYVQLATLLALPVAELEVLPAFHAMHPPSAILQEAAASALVYITTMEQQRVHPVITVVSHASTALLQAV